MELKQLGTQILLIIITDYGKVHDQQKIKKNIKFLFVCLFSSRLQEQTQYGKETIEGTRKFFSPNFNKKRGSVKEWNGIRKGGVHYSTFCRKFTFVANVFKKKFH